MVVRRLTETESLVYGYEWLFVSGEKCTDVCAIIFFARGLRRITALSGGEAGGRHGVIRDFIIDALFHGRFRCYQAYFHRLLSSALDHRERRLMASVYEITAEASSFMYVFPMIFLPMPYILE